MARATPSPSTILRTPDGHADDAALQSSVRLQLKVRDDITAVSNMTNQLEWMRRQLEDQSKTLAGKESLLKLIDDIDKKMQDVEYQLITRADALSDDKYFQTAYNLYQNFLWLNGEIGTGAGDVQGSGRLGRHGDRHRPGAGSRKDAGEGEGRVQEP